MDWSGETTGTPPLTWWTVMETAPVRLGEASILEEPPPPCANGVKWHLDNLDLGWGNSISSAQGWSGCNHFQHFDLPNQQGPNIMCPPNCWSMPGMDNKTESLLWFAWIPGADCKD
jgi:hypothetical protein